MTKEVTVYYDFEPRIGVNATCCDWYTRNQFFKSWSEFTFFLLAEYGQNFTLVEITNENYPELCAQGVFDEL
jgi:hypothetical protein